MRPKKRKKKKLLGRQAVRGRAEFAFTRSPTGAAVFARVGDLTRKKGFLLLGCAGKESSMLLVPSPTMQGEDIKGGAQCHLYRPFKLRGDTDREFTSIPISVGEGKGRWTSIIYNWLAKEKGVGASTDRDWGLSFLLSEDTWGKKKN